MRLFERIIQTASLFAFVALGSRELLKAQDYSPFEIGVHGASLTLADPIKITDEKAGVGVRATYNLSRILAWDSEADFFPGQSPTGWQRGGRAFTILTGPKAGWHWNRIGLFVKAQPGIANFSNIIRVQTGICNGVPCVTTFPGGHITHFTMTLGGGIEVLTTRRSFLRFDVGEMLLRYGDRVYPIPRTSGSIEAPGVVGNSLLITAGIGYRFGEREDQSVLTQKPRRWEIGGQYGLLSLGSAKVIDDLHNPTLAFIPVSLGDYKSAGGRLTYNFSRWLALESIVNFHYPAPNIGDAQRGGRILQGSFGPKAGVRTNRYGFFVKAQPGFLSYGAVHDNYFPPFPTQRLTHFALEVGGVLEYYPSRRTILRFDLAHTLAFYEPQSVVAPQKPPFVGNFTDYAFHDNGIQLSAGFGWRF